MWIAISLLESCWLIRGFLGVWDANFCDPLVVFWSESAIVRHKSNKQFDVMDLWSNLHRSLAIVGGLNDIAEFDLIQTLRKEILLWWTSSKVVRLGSDHKPTRCRTSICFGFLECAIRSVCIYLMISRLLIAAIAISAVFPKRSYLVVRFSYAVLM